MDEVMHILRYGTNAEQKYIRNHIGTFDCLAINANMVAHSSKAISSFVLEIVNMDKSFLLILLHIHFNTHWIKLSPIQKKNNEVKIKKSIEKLIIKYGEPISSVINSDRPILPDDFSDDILQDFCKNVIDFQLQTVTTNIDEDVQEFLEFDTDETIDVQFKPNCVIPPYFYIDDIEWLKLNIKFINIARQLYPQETIHAQIVISPLMLDIF